jgi:ribosome biogenesis GTPase
VQLPNGALVIDTPGMREIQLEANHEEGLGLSFGVIEERALRCRFSDCLHASEPGCAVKAALEAGAILPEDFENYLKIRRELTHQERKVSKVAASDEKKRWAAASKAARSHPKKRR